MSASGYLRIIRPVNAIAAGLATSLGYIIATGRPVPALILPMAVVFLVTSAGNAANDLYDERIDRINRPDRPIPSGEVTPAGAATFSLLLFLAGVGLALLANPLCFSIALINSLLLIGYAARLKRIALAGNIVVSYLSCSIFLFGGAFAGPDGLFANLGLASLTFLAMMSRELLKSAEDLEGDLAGGAVTFAGVHGVDATCRAGLLCISIAVLISILPVAPGWGAPYLAGIAIADGIMIAGAFRAAGCSSPACVKDSRATTMLKAGMFVAIAVFTATALLAT